jgi:hypothetical protein
MPGSFENSLTAFSNNDDGSCINYEAAKLQLF